MKALIDYSRFDHLKGVSGIYMFINTINDKVYVGRSINIYSRIGEHYRHSHNINGSCYNTHFYKALRYYDFAVWDVICLYETDNLELMYQKELEYIIKYDSVNQGYNSVYETRNVSICIGEKNGNALLTNQEVYFIREKYAEICYSSDIYDMFKNKISYSTFINIWRGYTWKTVHMDVYTSSNREKHIIAIRQRNHIKIYEEEKYKVNREHVWSIRQYYAKEQLSHTEVRNLFPQMNLSVFNDIWYGKTFKEIMPPEYLQVKKRGRKYIRRGNNKGEKIKI